MFNPATLTFTALNPTGKDDSNDQENWNILPSGRVLTVDSRTAQRSELYNPATNNWEPAVDTQVNLADVGAGTKNSSEVGPAVQRPESGWTGARLSGSRFDHPRLAAGLPCSLTAVHVRRKLLMLLPRNSISSACCTR